ncbi:MAG: hypothetical protein ABGY75_06025 [Gemmataceae bacterium]
MSAAAQPGDPKPLAVPAEQHARAKELVRKLDDDDVGVRDQASADLKAMGRLALPTLVEALKGKPSYEVSVRVDKLLPLARKDDFEARSPVFLADADGKFDHTFPGWTELKTAAGDTPETRKLFTAILKEDEYREALTGVFAVTADERKLFEERWQAKFLKWLTPARAGQPPVWPVEWHAAALLADLVYARDYVDHARLKPLLAVLNSETGQQALAGKGSYGAAFPALIRHWVISQHGQNGMYTAAQLCAIPNWGGGSRLDWNCTRNCS